MIFRHQLFHVHRPHHHLLPINRLEPWLRLLCSLSRILLHPYPPVLQCFVSTIAHLFPCSRSYGGIFSHLLRERWKQLGGWDRVRIEYVHQERALKERLSDLAEILEEKGFEIERFKPELSEEQFSWLLSQKGTIKRHLKGIEIGENGGR